MRLNMQILAEHFPDDEIVDLHISDTTVLDIRNVRIFHRRRSRTGRIMCI